MKGGFLIERLVCGLIENRNSLNSRLLSNNFLYKYKRLLGLRVSKFNFFKISLELRRLQKRRKLYIYVGKLVFSKFQQWLIITVFIFKPLKIKVLKKRRRRFSRLRVTKPYLTQYLQNALTSVNSPMFYAF